MTKEINLKDLQKIHPAFTEELKAEWEKWGFSTEECQEWLALDLDITEAQLARWLKKKKYITKEKKDERNWYLSLWWKNEEKLFHRSKKEQLKNEYLDSWGVIHPDFVDNPHSWFDEAYQKNWEERGLTYQNAQEWIPIGLEPYEYELAAYLKKEGYEPQQVKNNFEFLKWKSIHPAFTEELKAEWENRNFYDFEARKWIKEGLTPFEAGLASYLRYKDLNHYSEDLDITQLRTEYLANPDWKDWTEIDKNFAEKEYNKIYQDRLRNYQRIWEKAGFIVQEAQQWIVNGFEPGDYEKLLKWKKWKSQGFILSQNQAWLFNSLDKDEAEFAVYLKQKNLTSEQAKDNLEEWRGKFCQAQRYFEEKYPLENRDQIEEIEISEKNLQGTLIIQDFLQLKKIYCENNQLTELNIINCPQLTELDCSKNNLVSLKINNSEKFNKISCFSNQLSNLEFLTNLNLEKLITLWINSNNFPAQCLDVFSKFVNLESLDVSDNPFTGNFKPLKNLTKLKYLVFKDTDLISTWEYLPKLSEIILNDEDYNYDEIEAGELSLYEKMKNVNESEEHKNDTYNLQLWRQDQPAFKLLQQSLNNNKLDIWEALNQQEIFFNVKTGTFEGNTESLITFLQQHGLIREKDGQINLLKLLIAQLKCSRQDLMQKISEAYLSFPTEKETLKILIQARLELTNLLKNSLDESAINLQSTSFYQVFSELANKLKPEMLGKLEAIMSDCQELVIKEFELQAKLNTRMEIDYQNQQIKNITYNINAPITAQQGHILFNNLIGEQANFSQNKTITNFQTQSHNDGNLGENNTLATNTQYQGNNYASRGELILSDNTNVTSKQVKISDPQQLIINQTPRSSRLPVPKKGGKLAATKKPLVAQQIQPFPSKIPLLVWRPLLMAKALD